MGILRGIEIDSVEPLIEAVINAGLRTIEITMNTKNASDIIRKTVKIAQKRLTVGAGTVLNIESLRAALDAGASFIVSPTLIPAVIKHCTNNTIPVFPGALTPQEILNAWDSGASMVKVFPARFFGPRYFQEIKGPFNDIELLACGGITTENIKTFLSSGASAIAIGASVFKKELIYAREFSHITERIQAIIRASQ
ncbi:MAG: bifunctional 4-hydroxy-2-oxoglutarate aldolase/2-dehydro-3-deoxy-phosphogluconate aldolase [Candidatus Omnitrophica bacterium]|nr:bifunctional 4-hydroxy-2-oxoglutarate aldolase/2-dehydro-3-deoxy-phosphogluconate aldolase [Candidatus Omnitrophota bacterium]